MPWVWCYAWPHMCSQNHTVGGFSLPLSESEGAISQYSSVHLGLFWQVIMFLVGICSFLFLKLVWGYFYTFPYHSLLLSHWSPAKIWKLCYSIPHCQLAKGWLFVTSRLPMCTTLKPQRTCTELNIKKCK